MDNHEHHQNLVKCGTTFHCMEDEFIQRGSDLSYQPKAMKPAPRKEDSEEVTLTFNLDYDADKFGIGNMPYIYIYNTQNQYMCWLWGDGNTFETTVQKGTYGISIGFINYETSSPYLVIVNDVEINDDKTISLSPEMATNKIEITNYNPDGTIQTLPLGYWDPLTGERVITDEGNVESQYCAYEIYCNGLGGVLAGTNSSVMVSSEELRHLPAIWISDCGDNYYMNLNCLSYDDKNEIINFYVSTFGTDNMGIGKLENNPQEYVFSEDVWEFTPKGMDASVGWYGFIPSIVSTYNGFQHACSYMELHCFADLPKSQSTSLRMYVQMPFDNPFDEKLKQLIRPGFHDRANPVEGMDGYYMFNSPVSGTYYYLKDGRKTYANFGNSDIMGVPRGPFWEELVKGGQPQADIKVLPAHPAFTYSDTKMKENFGSSCPINAVLTTNYYSPWDERNVTEISPYYIGRNGETRLCDDPSVTIKFNGSEIEESDMWDINTDGVYDFVYENTNISVDGLSGRNITTIHYDMSKEDNTPPTICMLQFKDAEDNIIDRFKTGAEGSMELAACDFNYRYNTEYYYGVYDCQPLNLKAEYSPYGKEEWTELEVDEVPELFREIGWGYFYRASLKDVEGAGEKGWFDLRFSMSDEAGNTHVQTVSPAFRIDDLVDTGIENNNQFTTTNKQEVYDLMGRCIGNNLSTSNKGISIVRRANGDVRKVVNK